MSIFKLFYFTVKKNFLLIVIGLMCTGIATCINLGIPFLNQFIVDEAIGKANTKLLSILAAILLIISLLEYLFNIIETYIFTKVAKRFINSVYSKITDNILLKNHDFFISQTSGEIAGKVSEAWGLEELFSPQLFSSIYSIITLTGATLILFKISQTLTVITLFGSLMAVFFIFLCNKFIQKHLPEALNKKIAVNSKFQEIILGIFEIRSNSSSPLFAKNCKKSIIDKCNFSLKFSTIINVLLKSSTLIITMMMIIILYFFGRKIIYDGFTIGTYFLVISYVQKITSPIMDIGTIFNQIKPIVVLAKRIEYQFSLNHDDHENVPTDAKNNVNYLILENISYSYKGSSCDILSNFNLIAKKGEVILIKGKNGTGKSTLLKILCGELKNASGRILFDGHVGIPQSYVSIVNQKPYIFDMSIRDNIILNEIFDSKKYFSILETLSFHKYFKLNILKEQKITNESVSGGQIKLIALARCLYRSKPILVFDEVFSNLDSSLKSIFIDYVKKHKSEHIFIFVEHTNECEQFADKIINLDNMVSS